MKLLISRMEIRHIREIRGFKKVEKLSYLLPLTSNLLPLSVYHRQGEHEPCATDVFFIDGKVATKLLCYLLAKG